MKGRIEISWIDPDGWESVRAVAGAYGLKLVSAAPSGRRSCRAVLEGRKEWLGRLEADMRDMNGAEPFLTGLPAERTAYLEWRAAKIRSAV